MKAALITGSYPPEVCGVGDYTSALAAALGAAGASVEIVHERDWSPLRMAGVRRRLLAIGADILHMQYPTKGYGWQLGPQTLALSIPLVMTLHEASQVHVLRQLSLLPLTLRSPMVIMTNEYEQAYLARLAPWIRRRSVVIPIGSNIKAQKACAKMPGSVVTYFGLIRPEKGLENVLKLAAIFKERGDSFSVRIMGVPSPGSEAYYSRLRSQSGDLPVEWLIELPRERIQEELARTSMAYLPFPDGASERRGSLIGMMMHSVAIVTTIGEQTPRAMSDAVLFAQTPQAAAAALAGLVQQPGERMALQQRASKYAERFSWERIAAQHVRVYADLTQPRRV